MKHTPGPWKWNEGIPEKYDLVWLEGIEKKRIITTYGNSEWDKTPDARLIAAAPDLLEALEFAKLQLADVGINHSKINKAIAKAEGK